VIAGELPPALVERVQAAARDNPGAVAAFDADGTLWRDDVGEAFLRHLVQLGWVKMPDGQDPSAAYEREVQRDKAQGYAYAAQLLAGLLATEVSAEAERFAPAWVKPRLISGTRALRALCEASGLMPVVISASALAIVRAAAPLAGFPPGRCHGIETRTDAKGRLTERLVLPITYAEGKVAVAAKLGKLAVAAGDSFTGDLPLLVAARVAVVVAPRAGSPLADEARRRSWPLFAQDA